MVRIIFDLLTMQTCLKCSQFSQELTPWGYREYCSWTNINKENITKRNCPIKGVVPPSWRLKN